MIGIAVEIGCVKVATFLRDILLIIDPFEE
jgi:hypothetical protein